MKLKSLLSSLLLTILLVTQTLAQTPPAAPLEKSKEEEEKAQKELERKGLTLLEETLNSAQQLKLPENRAYIFAAAADLLWKHDEKRARVFFQEALTNLSEAMKSTGVGNDFGASLWTFINQRQQIITKIARRDPQLALDLLQSTRQAFTDNLPSYARMMDQELMLEQSIAAEVAAKDPKRALQMAQESLAKGVSYQTLNLLRKLQQKDSDSAATFTGDIIKKLGSTDFAKEHEASYVAQGLLRMLIQPERPRAAAGTTDKTKSITPLSVDDQTLRDLIDIVTTAAMNSSPDRPNVMMIQSLLPEIEKRAPESAAQIRRKLAETNEKMDPRFKQMYQYSELMREGKPEAMIEAAAKAPPDVRTNLYRMAVTNMVKDGDLEGARKVVVDNLTGDDRDRWLANIDQQLIQRALKADKVEEARKMLERINPKEVRLGQIANLATSLFKKGDRKSALLLLDETQELVNRPPENQQEIKAMIQVARAFALIEPARVFRILEPVVDQANALLAAAALLEKFGADRGIFKDGEFKMQTTWSYSYAFSVQYQKEMAALARADFARTRALADRFQRDEARLLARITLAQAVLADPSETKNENGAETAEDDSE